MGSTTYSKFLMYFTQFLFGFRIISFYQKEFFRSFSLVFLGKIKLTVICKAQVSSYRAYRVGCE